MRITVSQSLQKSFAYHFDYIEKLSQLNQSKLELLSKKYNMTPDEINTFSNCDPTPNKQYLDWLIKQIQSNALRLPEDCDKCINTLSLFTVKKQVLKNNSKPIDINQYKTLGNIQQVLDEVMGLNTNRQQFKINTEQGQKVIADQPPYKIIEITTPEAAAKLCRDTSWCIKDPKFFNDYKMGPSNPVYLILRDNQRYALFHAESEQFKNVYDDELKLDVKQNIDILHILQNNNINVKSYVLANDYGRYENYPVNMTKKEQIVNDFMTKEDILNSPRLAWLYTKNIIDKRWPEAEPIIMKDPDAAYEYAYYIIKGRWKEAEPIIATNAVAAYKYANYVIRKRWPEAEQIIMKDPWSAYQYAYNILQTRWPEAEPYIMKDPESASNYAAKLMKSEKGWPEAEPYIMQDSQCAYLYAYYTLRRRWPEAEPYIMKDPRNSVMYARDLIRDRWPEAEPYIMKDPHLAYTYADSVINDRWPEAEPYIMKDPYSAIAYANRLIHSRWPEAEPYIMKNQRAIYIYANEIIHGRWPEAEKYLNKYNDYAKIYADTFGIRL